MAIGLRSRSRRTQEQYDAVHQWDREPPEGLIFHPPARSRGWGIIDFWESREHFDRFQQPARPARAGDRHQSPRTSSVNHKPSGWDSTSHRC